MKKSLLSSLMIVAGIFLLNNVNASECPETYTDVLGGVHYFSAANFQPQGNGINSSGNFYCDYGTDQLFGITIPGNVIVNQPGNWNQGINNWWCRNSNPVNCQYTIVSSK